MRKNKDRCQHCGKWVRLCALYTLYGAANGHPQEESVAICEKCKYPPEYWHAWLDKRFTQEKS
jgi:hypothetical protein